MITEHEVKEAHKQANLDKLIVDALAMYARTDSVDSGVLAQAALDAIARKNEDI